jgi:hypothetical protein
MGGTTYQQEGIHERNFAEANMSIFYVIESRRSGDLVDFYVVFRDGFLQVGSIFTLFDTHHPIDFTVRELRDITKAVTLIRASCAGTLPYNSFAQETTVDTSDQSYAKSHKSLLRGRA